MISDEVRRLLRYRRLALITILVTLGLIMLGAGVRLTDAGLGCPDWPGCYGHLTPTSAADKISAAVAEQGGEHGPVSMEKAWREMVHRYVAVGLGLLVIALVVLGWRWRRDLPGSPWFVTALLAVVILQGFFGKWTVTLLLKPAIVTGHLLGAMLTLGLLTWLWRRLAEARVDDRPVARPGLRALALLGLFAVIAQITLGGWTSTNYAALACSDLPLCQGRWWPDSDFEHGFHIVRELGEAPDGTPLSTRALTAIHLAHRIGAIVVTVCIVILAFAVRSSRHTRVFYGPLLTVLGLQVMLGLSNIWFELPLAVAIAHTGGAGLLLMMVVMVNYRLTQPARIPRPTGTP